jgi:ArsR family transcriptional regulator
MPTLSFDVTREDPLPSVETAEGPEPAAVARLDEALARQLAQWFRLLADETRLQILYFLMQRSELNVRALCDLLAQSQPAVSHHLGLLREAGLLACRRDGKHNYYRLVPRQCRVLLDTLFGVTGQQVRRLRIDDACLTYGRDGRAAT